MEAVWRLDCTVAGHDSLHSVAEQGRKDKVGWSTAPESRLCCYQDESMGRSGERMFCLPGRRLAKYYTPVPESEKRKLE